MIRILAVVKILVEILWFSTEISWDSCPVTYLWSCFYYEFHYEMSIKCMIRILALVKIIVEILWFSTEISWDSCPVHYLWSCFYYEFHYEISVKCMIRILAIVKIMVKILMIQYWNIMRSMSGSLFMKLFLLRISLWNVYKVHDQDSGHSKNYDGNL